MYTFMYVFWFWYWNETGTARILYTDIYVSGRIELNY